MIHRSVLGAVAVSTAIVVAGCGGGSSSKSSAAPQTNATTTTTSAGRAGVELHYEATPIAHESGTLTLNANGVWVFPHLDPVGIHITAKTRKVDRTVDMQDYATGSATQGRYVYTVLPFNHAQLLERDPNTLALTKRWNDLPVEEPDAGFGVIWSIGRDGVLYRIDPVSHAVTKIQSGDTTWFNMAMTDTDVWTLAKKRLQRINPRTGAVVDESALLRLLPKTPTGIGAAGHALVLSTGDKSYIVNPSTKKVTATVTAPAGYLFVDWYTAKDAGNGTYWAGLTPEKWGTSVDIPRGTATPETFIYRVDTATGRVIASVKTPFPEDFEPAHDGGLWIAPLRDARVLYVAPQ